MRSLKLNLKTTLAVATIAILGAVGTASAQGKITIPDNDTLYCEWRQLMTLEIMVVGEQGLRRQQVKEIIHSAYDNQPNRRQYLLRLTDRLYTGDLRGIGAKLASETAYAECPSKLRLKKG